MDAVAAKNEIRVLSERKAEVQGAVMDSVYTLSDLDDRINQAKTQLDGIQRKGQAEQTLTDEYEALRKAKADELSGVHDRLIELNLEADKASKHTAELKADEALWESQQSKRDAVEKARIDSLFKSEHDQLDSVIASRKAEEALLAETKQAREQAQANTAAAVVEEKQINSEIETYRSSLTKVKSDVDNATANLNKVETLAQSYQDSVEKAKSDLAETLAKKAEAENATASANATLKDAQDKLAQTKKQTSDLEATSQALDARKRGLDAREAYIASMFEKQGIHYQPYKAG